MSPHCKESYYDLMNVYTRRELLQLRQILHIGEDLEREAQRKAEEDAKAEARKNQPRGNF